MSNTGLANLLASALEKYAYSGGRSFDNASDANVGQSVLISAGMSNQQVLRADGKSLDSGQINLTIFYTEDVPSPAPNDLFINAFCTLKWGAGHVTSEVSFDLCRGTVISLPGSMVDLRCTYPLVANTTQPDLRVNAVLGYGTRSGSDGTRPPTRLTYSFLLAGGLTTSPVRIPVGATSVSVQTSTLAANMTLTQVNAPAGNIQSQNAPGATNIPIGNGMQYWTVTNNGGGGAVRVTVIFYLSL